MNQSQNEIFHRTIDISNSDEFENIIRDLKSSLNRIDNSFKNENNFMRKIDKTDIWFGEAQEKLYAKYLELSKCYNPVVESLSIYIKFLENVVSSYKNAELVMNNDIDDNSENFIVN